MFKIKRFSLRKSEDGFTLMEAAVSLVILSLLSVVVWQGLINAGKLIGKTTDYSLNTAQTLQLDNYVRKKVSEVTPPFWSGTIDMESEPDRVRIPYYKGETETLLVITFEKDYLTLAIQKKDEEQPDEIKSFGPFSDVKIELAFDKDDTACGIGFDITPFKSSDKPIQIVTRFGSNPYLLKGD